MTNEIKRAKELATAARAPGEKRIYRVTVEREVYVLATSAEEAETWCLDEGAWDIESNEEATASAFAIAKIAEVSKDERDALPWVAIDDELVADEMDQTIEWWLARRKP